MRPDPKSVQGSWCGCLMCLSLLCGSLAPPAPYSEDICPGIEGDWLHLKSLCRVRTVWQGLLEHAMAIYPISSKQARMQSAVCRNLNP